MIDKLQHEIAKTQQSYTTAATPIMSPVSFPSPFSPPTMCPQYSTYTPHTTTPVASHQAPISSLQVPVQSSDDADVLSILSECFSDSSFVSASNFGEFAGYATGTTSTDNLSSATAAAVHEWVKNGFSKRLTADEILLDAENDHLKNSSGLPKLARLLVRHTFFGERRLGLSSLTGKKGAALDVMKMKSLKSLLRGVLPNMAAVEFEKEWIKCKQSITDVCKRERSKMKTYNLLQKAAQLEGVPVPMD